MLPHIPTAPNYLVPWQELDQRYSWIHALQGCVQDPIHHAEGDVWIHVRMVLEALVALPAWRCLSETERAEVYWAALLHDVAKPSTTVIEPDGRVSARGHSRLGAIMAREILWRMDCPFAARERICNLIRYHQVPFWLMERPDPERLLMEVSCTARCDHLAILAEADLRGRICQDEKRVLDNIALFGMLSAELGCLEKPFSFADNPTRFLYFRERWHAPRVAAGVPFKSEVIVMSALPGTGKDYWLAKNHPDLPVISLDNIRREHDWPSTGSQGRVIAEGKERARDFLRKGLPFAWNATNLSKRLREGLLDFMDKYHARIKLVYLEKDHKTLFSQNRSRAFPVPEAAMARMLSRWEVPDPYEGWEVLYVT